MSRELDAEVHRKIFGQSVCKYDPIPNGTRCAKCGMAQSYCGKTHPLYSTSISDAWLVVEKMREKGFPFELGDAREGYYATYWNECNAAVYGNSMPECICRAALQAIEGGKTR